MKLFGFGFLFCFMIGYCSLGAQAAEGAVPQPEAAHTVFKTPALDGARIQEKCAVYQKAIARIEARRTIVFGVAGVLGAAAAIYFIHQWFTQKSAAAGDSGNGVAIRSNIKIDHEALRQLETIIAQRAIKESTFGGKTALIFEHTRDRLVEVFLLSILLYPFNRLLGSVTEKASGLLWFNGEKKLATAEQVFLRDARFFYQSFGSFLKTAASDATKTTLYVQRLADQVKRGVGTDFVALCYTLEECFALLLACINQFGDDLTDDDRRGLEGDVAVMCDVFNAAAQEIAVVIDVGAGSMDDATASMLVLQLQKLLGECERLMHAVGMRLFGERFAL